MTADVNHQLQGRVPVFGRLASRTTLVVHFWGRRTAQNFKGKMSTTCKFSITFKAARAVSHRSESGGKRFLKMWVPASVSFNTGGVCDTR